MAAQNRQTSSYVAFLKRAADIPQKFNLFALLRGASARATDRPPVGMSKLPSQDIAELRQTPHVHYPAPTLNNISLEKDKVVVDGYWLGLTGPMSPLPLHLTEFAVYERRYAKKQPFSDFLDLLAGRFLQLFYRAWADGKPHVQADRINNDRFANYVSKLSGADEGADENSAFPGTSRLHYAALFASRRSAGSIEGGLAHLLGMPVEVTEFVPRWRDIEPDDRTRLGGQHNRLGDATLGEKMLQVTDCFEAKIFARNIQEFRQLMPSGNLFRVAAEALTAFAPSHLEWTITLSLPQEDVPAARLDGMAQLGWSSWLGHSASNTTRNDVHLGRHALQKI